jgi:hypothetical protein
MLYETRKISLFFFLARGIVSSLCLLEIQTLESSKARKSKDEEAERRTNKKKAKFRAETIISASVKGRKKQLSRTNSTPLFSFLSLSFVRVSLFIARNGTPSVETARCREQRHHRDEPATNSRRTSGASSSFFSFFLF